MKVGLIGLGKMGLNLGQNLIDNKHEVVAFEVLVLRDLTSFRNNH